MMGIATTEESMENSMHLFQSPEWGGRQLRNISLFDELSDAELVELYRLGQLLQASSKSNIVIEGENTRGLFILLEGRVSVYKADRTNNSMIRLAYLEPGAIFGELSLFDDAPRSATVIAESPCYLFNLDESRFADYLLKAGDSMQVRFFRRCAEVMVARFRQQNSDYVISQKLLWTYALRKDENEATAKSVVVASGASNDGS